MDRLQLSAWIEEATTASLSLGRYSLRIQSTDMGISESEMIHRMNTALKVM